MITAYVHATSPLPTAHGAANMAACAFGHRAHSGTCAGCQQVQALRQAAQLNAAIAANAQWRLCSPPEQRGKRELDSLNWVRPIRVALTEQRLVLHAQPIIDLRSRRDVMHELLLRMVDRDGAIIAPGRFLPAAKHLGLIEDIDRWVIIQAVTLAARGLKVQFNISAQSLGSRALIGDLVRTLRDTGADPGLLICEMPATALAGGEAVPRRFVHELAGLGCGIALDGFGGFTGFKDLPLATLKIGAEVARELLGNPKNQRVVKKFVDLAQGFGGKTIVLGAEAEATLALLQECGVDYAQGFAIGRPAPIDASAKTTR